MRGVFPLGWLAFHELPITAGANHALTSIPLRETRTIAQRRWRPLETWLLAVVQRAAAH